jgi:hypothetical protein
VDEADSYALVDQIAGDVLAADDPIEVAGAGANLIVDHISDRKIGTLAASLYCVWAELAGQADGPLPGFPDLREHGLDGLRRSAAACRALPPDLRVREAWAERWMYEECGYERPTRREAAWQKLQWWLRDRFGHGHVRPFRSGH